MKIKINGKRMFYAMTALALFASCQKNEMDLTSSESSLEDVIAVATSAMAATGSASGAVDSVYLLQACKQGETRNPISQADLPSVLFTYLTDNYSGSVFSKAFALKNSTAAVTGYVVVIYFNDKPVGLQFDENGNFVKVLEQREKNDLRGAGHHQGGRFEHRDGRHRDTLALTSLPATVTAYMATTFASDTLIKAFQNKDGSLLVLSKNTELFATSFSADGVFVNRSQLQTRAGQPQVIELAALPSAAANYLAQAYPNYVFEKAFAIKHQGAVGGFIVVIDANNTKYAILFDAAGTFQKAKTIY